MEVDESNPFEADTSEQIPDIISLQETIEGSSASYSWEGNDFALEFRYKLEADSLSGLDNEDRRVSQPYFEWSNWITEKNVEFPDLDEGKYTFHIQSRFDLVVEKEPYKSSSFEINALSGPALRIYPLHQKAMAGDTIDVYLYLEDANPINLLQATLTFTASDGSSPAAEINGDVEDISCSRHCSTSNNVNPCDFIIPPSISGGGSGITITHVYLEADGFCGTGPLVRIPLKVLATDGNININIEEGGDFKYYNIDGYIRQMQHYLKHGDWVDSQYGEFQEKSIKWRTIAAPPQQLI